jgi:feruloyl esterase
VAKCDALDGASDGMVLNVKACQSNFSLAADVPTCTGARDGSCLTPAQKTAIANVFSGARNSSGQALYASFPYDPGVGYGNWALWKYTLNTSLGASAMPYIFVTPPQQVASADLLSYVLRYSMDTDAPMISATSGIFTQSSLSFMTPPNASDLSTLKNRGAKLMVYHGTGDAVFSSNDTAAWYDSLRTANGGDASGFARYFEVPGMNHCSGGAATDQFDMLTALVNWVEKGQAPDRVIASVRGAGNPGGVNAELPASWAANRTRPLCPYPQTPRYSGSGSLENAASFTCQ